MPTVLRTNPQKMSDKNIINVESPRPLPINFGSRTLPTPILIATKMTIVHNAPTKPICIKANATAGMAAMMDPIFGI